MLMQMFSVIMLMSSIIEIIIQNSATLIFY